LNFATTCRHSNFVAIALVMPISRAVEQLWWGFIREFLGAVNRNWVYVRETLVRTDQYSIAISYNKASLLL
jgi:hypothetical protein